MSRLDIYIRVILYLVVSVLPVVISGIEANKPTIQIVLEAVLAGAVTLRAFLDESINQFKKVGG